MIILKKEVEQVPRQCPYVVQGCGLKMGCPYKKYRRSIAGFTRHFIGQVISCKWQIKDRL